MPIVLPYVTVDPAPKEIELDFLLFEFRESTSYEKQC
jgi:hypothetical protein